MSLKVSYRGKWGVGVRRELLLLNILNILLPSGFKALATGLGTGTSDYIDGNYTNPLDAFDIVVYKQTDNGLEPAAYIDVTGFREEKAAKKQDGRALLCIGSWKLFKAQEFGLESRAWAVHIADKRVSLRWIQFSKLSRSNPERIRLIQGENIYYCLPQEKWHDTSTFLNWLKAARG